MASYVCSRALDGQLPYTDQLLPLISFWYRIASRKLVLFFTWSVQGLLSAAASQRITMRAQVNFVI